jgi:hypothetical protein
MSADISAGIGNADINTWVTTQTNTNTLFSTVGSSFDGKTFTVPEEGFYFSALNVRMDAIETAYARIYVTPVSNAYSADQGLHVIKGNMKANYYTLRYGRIRRF